MRLRLSASTCRRAHASFGYHFLWLFVAVAPLQASDRCLPVNTQQAASCRQSLPFSGPNSGSQIPLYATDPLDVSHPNIERAVIVIHGILLDADDYFVSMVKAAELAGKLDNTLVLAPQFPDAPAGGPGNQLYWDSSPDHHWKWGDLSTPKSKDPTSKDPAGVSSFAVIDILLERLANNPNFPRLKSLTLIGHSAGGQFLSRYAVGNASRDFPGIRKHFIIANPSTYLYLDSRRPLSGSVNEFSAPNAADCPDFDDYHYGMAHRNAYMNRLSVPELVTQFAMSEVSFLLGEQDTLEDGLDESCAAMLQGRNRWERGQAYFHYLENYYPSSKHHRVTVPGVGHDHGLIFQSKEGMATLFGP